MPFAQSIEFSSLTSVEKDLYKHSVKLVKKIEEMPNNNTDAFSKWNDEFYALVRAPRDLLKESSLASPRIPVHLLAIMFTLRETNKRLDKDVYDRQLGLAKVHKDYHTYDTVGGAPVTTEGSGPAGPQTANRVSSEEVVVMDYQPGITKSKTGSDGAKDPVNDNSVDKVAKPRPTKNKKTSRPTATDTAGAQDEHRKEDAKDDVAKPKPAIAPRKRGGLPVPRRKKGEAERAPSPILVSDGEGVIAPPIPPNPVPPPDGKFRNRKAVMDWLAGPNPAIRRPTSGDVTGRFINIYATEEPVRDAEYAILGDPAFIGAVQCSRCLSAGIDCVWCPRHSMVCVGCLTKKLACSLAPETEGQGTVSGPQPTRFLMRWHVLQILRRDTGQTVAGPNDYLLLPKGITGKVSSGKKAPTDATNRRGYELPGVPSVLINGKPPSVAHSEEADDAGEESDAVMAEAGPAAESTASFARAKGSASAQVEGLTELVATKDKGKAREDFGKGGLEGMGKQGATAPTTQTPASTTPQVTRAPQPTRRSEPRPSPMQLLETLLPHPDPDVEADRFEEMPSVTAMMKSKVPTEQSKMAENSTAHTHQALAQPQGQSLERASLSPTEEALQAFLLVTGEAVVERLFPVIEQAINDNERTHQAHVSHLLQQLDHLGGPEEEEE
ncbi:hypothetical protein BXZ70DRAFT_907608 [Cristinia sonorae]|uniref:Uncharacterized protein n=2 Tax=Cristinia sonorae TaxID=1940300 RepID=A0A8K0XP88_9AGAR|nr:hypothetical protein BXZ70DRAFT_907608 [Cristinia sonorae]